MLPSRLAVGLTLLFAPSLAEAEGLQLYRYRGSDTYGQGVSDDGEVLVGQHSGSATTTDVFAFRATSAGVIESLGDFPFGITFSDGRTANEDGSVVIGVGHQGAPKSKLDEQVGFQWTRATGLVSLGDLPGGPVLSFVSDITPDARVVVGAGYPATTDFIAFRLENGVFTQLGAFPAMSRASSAYGVSDDGTVIVGSSRLTVMGNDEVRAFRWTAMGGLIDLGDLPGATPYASAQAVSGDGLVAVGSSSSMSSGADYLEGVRWVLGQPPQALGDLAGGPFSSEALDTNRDGSVIVGRSTINDAEEEAAFYWTAADGMRDLNTIAAGRGIDLQGVVLRQARAVSADGLVVVGIAQGPMGISAFRLDLRRPILPDAGVPDAPPAEVGSLDATSLPDAISFPDALSSPDAASPPDAGLVADAASGARDSGPGDPVDSCSDCCCASTGSSETPVLSVGLLVMLGLSRARLRRRS